MNIEELNHRLKDAALEYLTDEQKLIAAYASGYNDGISLSQWAELNKPVEKTPLPDPAPDVRDERRKHLDSLDIAPAFPANRSRITNKGKTMSEKKKPELKVTLHEHFYINPDQGWFWIVTNIYGTEITSHKTYARMASAKRGAIRSLTNLGLAAKYQLVFEVDK